MERILLLMEVLWSFERNAQHTFKRIRIVYDGCMEEKRRNI